MIAGAGLKMIGQTAETNARNDAEHRAATHNATVLEQQAHDDRAAAALKAAERRRDTRGRVGTSTALLAADGQATDDGDGFRLIKDLQDRGDFLADLDLEDGERLARNKRADARFTEQSADRKIKSRSRNSLLTSAAIGVEAAGKMY